MKVAFVLDLYRKISIKAKLMVIAVIFIIYPIIIIGYFGYRNYAGVMQEKAISDMQDTSRELKSLLSERMTKLSLFSIQILYDGIIYKANRDLANVNMDYVSQNEFTRFLQSNVFLKSELDEILIRFEGSNKVFQVNKTMGSTTSSASRIDDLYGCAVKGKGKPVWYVSCKDGNVTGIYIAKIIYDINEIKREIGLLVFKVNQQYLSEILNNYITASKLNVSMFSSDGQEVYALKPFETDYGKPLFDFANSIPDSSVKDVRIDGDTLYLLSETIQPDSWKLVMGISSNLLLKDVRNTARYTLVLCAITLPICFLLMNFFYIGIIRPMNLLIKSMRGIEKGGIGVTIASKRGDEFGYVYKTFNKMSREIENLINTVYKTQIATKDAEIKALQAQINPHFLYNTLEAINWKAKMNGVGEISDMVAAFSCIIHANLNKDNETFIPVHREVEYIKSYNFLIGKRFGQKIRFSLDVDEKALDFIIPKLIVQPIIENAIYHGLERKKGGGNIGIVIKMEGDTLLISVADDGLGIEADVLEKLKDNLTDNRYLDNEKNLDENSKIGILNVNRRIVLLYGEKYGLDISSESGKGTIVVIRLPANILKGKSEGVV